MVALVSLVFELVALVFALVSFVFALDSWEFFDLLLERTNVVGTPGSGFGAAGEMKNRPVLFAPRDKTLQAGGMSRESVHTLRAGWPPDPVESEIITIMITLTITIKRHLLQQFQLS